MDERVQPPEVDHDITTTAAPELIDRRRTDLMKPTIDETRPADEQRTKISIENLNFFYANVRLKDIVWRFQLTK
jgi:hypothetical protein